MSFFKMFGSQAPKKLKRTYDKAGLRQIYEEAKKSFLRGKLNQALDGFKNIYEHDTMFRDVATIVEDSYLMPKGKFAKKYKAHFRAQSTKEPEEDDGESGEDAGAGSAPIPAPKRPITPSGSFRAEKRPDKGDRSAQDRL